MRIIIRPIMDRQREIDLTQRLIAAIAEELWRLYGGNEQLNWLEAEMHLQRIVGETRAEARETRVRFAPPPILKAGRVTPRADRERTGKGRATADAGSRRRSVRRVLDAV